MADRETLTARAREMRNNPTPAERALWRLLRSDRLAGLKFRRQYRLGNYIADFVCLWPRLIIEVDGSQHREETAAYDAARDAWLRAEGFKVIRFWNGDVMGNLDGVRARILTEAGRGPSDGAA